MDARTSPEPIADPAQWAAWNGPEGAHWSRRDEASTEGLVGPLLDAAGLDAGSTVVDLGCGTGAATRAAARRAPGGRALGVDLSAPMIERARAASAGIPNVEFAVGDVQTQRFEPGAADVAVSHFGTMFFADPVAAFANVRRALRPDGRLVFVCPGPMAACDWYRVPLAALLGAAPTERSAPSAMFSQAEPEHLAAVLADAGFGRVGIEPLDATMRFGADTAEAADFFLGTGPVRAVLDARPGLDRPRQRLERALAPHQAADGVRLAGRHWLVTARPA